MRPLNAKKRSRATFICSRAPFLPLIDGFRRAWSRLIRDRSAPRRLVELWHEVSWEPDMLFLPLTLVRTEFICREMPTPACHASTLSETKSGDLVAAWFGGTAESRPDVGIFVSRCVAGEWTKPIEVAEPNPDRKTQFACYNPVLFQPKKGPLMLFYKVGKGPATWWGMLTRSHDDGRTWDAPTRLPNGILGPIKNRPLELPGGGLLCPSSSEDRGWRIHFELTRDQGKTWTSTAPTDDGGIDAIQPSLLTMGNGKLRAIGRTRQGRLFAVDSNDLGETWGTVRLLDVPNPNSGADAIALRDGRFLLVYNNSASRRTPLNVALSTDGEHWTPMLTLESEPGEYSYPTVIQTSDGLVHITYTWRRQKIRHVVIDPGHSKETTSAAEMRKRAHLA